MGIVGACFVLPLRQAAARAFHASPHKGPWLPGVTFASILQMPQQPMNGCRPGLRLAEHNIVAAGADGAQGFRQRFEGLPDDLEGPQGVERGTGWRRR
jgi:hypothetical protein